MKSNFLICIGCMLLIGSCNDNHPQEKVTGEFENLLLDTELSRWKKQENFLFEVNDGVLSLSGENDGGWMYYQEEYEDFILECEFLVEPENKAGIAFRYNESLKGDPAYTGYKVVLDHDLNQQNPTGSIFNVARAKWLKSTKTEDWNKFAISAQGDYLKVMINDTIVAETHNKRSEEGLIGLYINAGSTAQFRNLMIQENEEADFIPPLIEDYLRSYTGKSLEPMIKEDNLDDWDQTGEASWEINDGVIHGYSNEKGGFLNSRNTFRNFYLKLKFKIKHEDNSGIFIRHTPEDVDEVTTDNAIECNIYDHDGFLHEYSTGSIAPIARSWSKMIDYEDWNDMEIFAFEDQICMYVNGIKSSEAHLSQQFNKKGNICIQGGIQVFNGNLPSDIYIKDMFIKDFEGIPFLGF